jgi:UDP-3-O-[3-hydroxymyristoyl] glucosamine N-acyltransferase
MTEPVFFRSRGTITLGEVIALTGAEPVGKVDLSRPIENIKPLDLAGPRDLTFFDHPRYLDNFRTTAAGACLVGRRNHAGAPEHVAVLVAKEPYRAFVTVARALFEAEIKPVSIFGARGIDPGAFVHPEARLEDGVEVDPGAVIGPRAEIGSGTVIGANAVIGADVRIGRDCAVGPGASVLHALVGDRVVMHPGARIGQDGFGYVPGQTGHLKVPQVGRVVVQDDVEIGAGSTIDRGSGRDTMIGEGTKIDNLVQIAHNVMIGRHCIIVALTGISGSCTLGDHVMLGGQVGLADHITVGDGAQIAATSGVMHDVPAGEQWAGAPAKPIREFFREVATLKRLAARPSKNGTGAADQSGKSKDDTSG